MKKLLIAAVLFSCQTTKPVEIKTKVTYWGAEWCPACVKYKPIVKADAESCGATFEEMDADDSNLLSKSAFSFRFIPVFTVRKNEKILYHGPWTKDIKGLICESY